MEDDLTPPSEEAEFFARADERLLRILGPSVPTDSLANTIHEQESKRVKGTRPDPEWKPPSRR